MSLRTSQSFVLQKVLKISMIMKSSVGKPEGPKSPSVRLASSKKHILEYRLQGCTRNVYRRSPVKGLGVIDEPTVGPFSSIKLNGFVDLFVFGRARGGHAHFMGIRTILYRLPKNYWIPLQQQSLPSKKIVKKSRVTFRHSIEGSELEEGALKVQSEVLGFFFVNEPIFIQSRPVV